MIQIGRNRTATQRLLRQPTSRGRRDIPALYLKAFGITDLSLSKPPAIVDPQFQAEWSAFVSSVNDLRGDPARRALRAALAFLRYADSLRLQVGNPHFQFRDPLTSQAKITPNAIRKALLKYQLVSQLELVKRVIEGNKLPFYFRVSKTKTTQVMDGGKPKLVSTYVLEPNKPRTRLDGLLTLMKGTLYDLTLPPQLAPITKTVGGKPKDIRPNANSMLTGAGIMGWYALARTPEFSLYVIRARGDNLVLKVIQTMDVPNKDLGDLPLAEWLKIWSKFKVF